MTLTKHDLAKQMAKQFYLSISECERIIDFQIATLKGTLASGKNRIEFRGFGSYYVTQQPARVYQHHQTGQIISIPDSKRVVFRQSKNFFPKRKK